MPIVRHQLIAKNAKGETVDAITSSLDRESALCVLSINPWLVVNRLALGWTIWWGNEEVTYADE